MGVDKEAFHAVGIPLDIDKVRELIIRFYPELREADDIVSIGITYQAEESTKSRFKRLVEAELKFTFARKVDQCQ